MRADVDAKHAQNRGDIHELRGDMQTVMDKQFDLSVRLAPFLGTADAKGIIPEMAENVKVIMQANAERTGAAKRSARGASWLRWIIGTIIGALGVAFGAKELLK